MRKFEVDVVYSGSIRVIVDAVDEDIAKRIAQEQVEKMPQQEFIADLDVAYEESDIVEEIT